MIDFYEFEHMWWREVKVGGIEKIILFCILQFIFIELVDIGGQSELQVTKNIIDHEAHCYRKNKTSSKSDSGKSIADKSEKVKNHVKKMTIIWIIGGPGCGKGTQCDKILKKYKLCHISSGDLLRAEVESGSEHGKELQKIMAQGQLISTDTVLDLINKKIEENKNNSEINGFLIDGYPRELDQGILFEKKVGCVDLIIFFDVKNETLLSRLLARAKGSTRADDNEETIKNRIALFNEKNGPIVEHYKEKCLTINAEGTVDSIFEEVSKTLDKLIKV